MDDQSRTFKDFDEINNFIQKKEVGHILIGYRNMSDYAGMVLGIGIIFNIAESKYELDLEWICFGLDLYGENLLENYSYKFSSLPELLKYLHLTYGITITDIPLSYKINQNLFPNPIKDADQKTLYQTTWQKFQNDFKKGIFLDKSLELVFSST